MDRSIRIPESGVWVSVGAQNSRGSRGRTLQALILPSGTRLRCAPSAMVHKAPLKIYARGVVSYFYFSRVPRALKIRQINSTILKVPDAAWSC